MVDLPSDDTQLFKYVSNADGGRKVPLTAEEVAEHYQRQADWEAARPQREEEAARQAEAAAMFRESLRYEDRIVAYLDVLGWGAAIQRSLVEPELVTTLGIAQNLLVGYAGHLNSVRIMMGDSESDAVHVTQFSDTIIVSAPISISGLEQVRSLLWFVTGTLLQQGLLVRGAIVVGQVYHRNGSIFGPALLDAHNGEKAACYPRVTIDRDLAEVALQNDRVIDGKTREYNYSHKNWRKDSDDVFFYDFLQPMGATTDTVKREHHVDYASRTLANVKKLALKSIAAFADDASKRAKHEWLLRYAQDVAGEYEIDFDTL